MSTNLRLYHTVLRQVNEWMPKERITRQRNMALLVMGVFLARSIHISHIVRKWPSASKEPSLVNRLRRFLDNTHVAPSEWYRPIAQQLVQAAGSGRSIRLVIDCTKVGSSARVMTISIAYRKRTLPLVWSVHKGGMGLTTVKEQLALFQQVRPLIPADQEVWVVGDSGFQWVTLLRWLRKQGWHFVIRQQGRIRVQSEGQPWRKLSEFELAPDDTRFIGWVQLTLKHQASDYWLVLHWEKGEEDPWYLVSDMPGRHNVIQRYKLRMWVEEMYGDFKGHGFDLEATHVSDTIRLDRLLLAICLAFVWLIAVGSRVVKNGLRHFVDHKSRRDKSYFRIGWDWIERCLRLDKPIPMTFRPYS
jgi:hypothetical protein